MPSTYSEKQKIKQAKRKKKTILIVSAAVLIVAVATLIALELTGVTNFFGPKVAESSTITKPSKVKPSSSNTKSPDTASSGDKNTNNGTSAPTDTGSSTTDTKDDGPQSTTALVAPYGDFVSNHHPGMNGAPTAESSVCITTPGAQCYIKFVSAANPAIVKTLAAGTADVNGAVYWNNWDVKSAGFTSGTWHIIAVATLNGKTLTTQDTASLEVQL